MNNVLSPLDASVLIPLGITAVATDAAIHRKMFRLGTTTLVFSNSDLNGIMKIFIYCEESSLLIKGVSETMNNEAKEQKEGFFQIILSSLGTSS